jgi:hypothetical protein
MGLYFKTNYIPKDGRDMALTMKTSFHMILLNRVLSLKK